MGIADFKERVRSGTPLAGTFMKTPAIDVLEVLILAGLDFVCLDAEHAPFERAAMNACAALARAADFPLLVRVPSSSAERIGMVLDLGAVGVVVPHVTDAETAARVARQSRFGPGGRGFAGSTRWAGFATRPMPELLAQSREETVVIAQIEDAEAVGAVEEIAATPGIDALFLGPADLSVGYGKDRQDSPELTAALARVGAAAKANGLGYATFVPNAAAARTLAEAHGLGMFFIASEQAWMLQGARAAVAGIREFS
ncbi:aldolase/citrate lyase family protein [Roseibacterium beibuensis]|uniref:Aldolase/citrate lyase family protein n=1 Tax=[Roseibacterium] beibuensis TaxID=1193142 RepID=A0ABP9KX82_9RHOB|nr:aldolase/citrate lyase family protein [Roseibacterium beibuensis]MCS6621812.1 aldolase/citrate lyase family protein [Roseibacterium beibuensis]